MGENSIEFTGEVFKVQTLVDGGIRLTLDLPESEIPQAAMLMECKRSGIPLKISATAGDLTDLDDETKKGMERESIRAGRRRSTNRRDQRKGG